MKYVLLLLAVMVSSVCGLQKINAEVTGFTDLNQSDLCTIEAQNALFDLCVTGEAVKLGVTQQCTKPERRELRGSRDLSCSLCNSRTYTGPGSWCYTKCSRRRLSLPVVVTEDEQISRFLAKLQGKSTLCYKHKQQNTSHPCLGNRDIIVTIFSESD
jgi:hypothetical protein